MRFLRRFLIGTLLVTTLGWIPAAGQIAQEEEATADATPRAPVVLDGVTLFHVRGSSTMSPEDRAAAIADRIRKVAKDASMSPDALRIEEKDSVVGIYAGDVRLFAILESDARAEGVTVRELAAAALIRVQRAISEYRADRAPEKLLRAAGYAVIATALLIVALVLLRLLWRKGWTILETRARHRLKTVGVATIEVVRADQLWQAVHGAARLIRGLLVTLTIYFYLYYVFSLFPGTRWAAVSLGGWILGPIVSMGRGILGLIPNAIFLGILFLVTRWVLRLLKLVFDRVEKGNVQFEGFFPEWAAPTYNLTRIGVIVFALVVAFPYIPGSDSLAFKGLSVFLGVLLSLGSTSAISNVIAGYTLIYRRAFKVGDRVQIGDVTGEVSQIRLQVTHVRTYKNEDVVIPNSKILDQEVKNFTTLCRSRGLLLHTTVGIGYEIPWRQVEAMLLEAARRTEGLLSEPPPFVLQLSLGDFAVVYEINVACDDTRTLAFRYADLHRNILDVFNEHGVQIMTPAYEGDPEKAKVVPKEQWFRSPADGGS